MGKDYCLGLDVKRRQLEPEIKELKERIKQVEAERDKLLGGFIGISVLIKEYYNGHHPPEIFVKHLISKIQKALLEEK